MSVIVLVKEDNTREGANIPKSLKSTEEAFNLDSLLFFHAAMPVMKTIHIEKDNCVLIMLEKQKLPTLKLSKHLKFLRFTVSFTLFFQILNMQNVCKDIETPFFLVSGYCLMDIGKKL